jgi:hypothetical protein
MSRARVSLPNSIDTCEEESNTTRGLLPIRLRAAGAKPRPLPTQKYSYVRAVVFFRVIAILVHADRDWRFSLLRCLFAILCFGLKRQNLRITQSRSGA